ncbi:cupin domain-containing protein [Dactylosporangium sp. NPDC048998]|uniref:cupin domain-containing protein n=1 Tax=Dactylosporangium sp. NPDC048998 TaxID=3363976 RepID=UPI003721C012
MRHVLNTSGPIPTAPVDESQVIEGSPQAGSRALAAVAGAEVGVWEMTPGTSTDVEIDEVFVVLSGSATVAFEDGSILTLSPGAAARLHAGDKTTWTVHETLRKIYIA